MTLCHQSLKRNKFIAPCKHYKGYIQINLNKDGKRKIYYLHRLLAIHFIPNPVIKPCIDHINRIRDDNRIENLRWATPEENMSNKTIHKNNKLGHMNISYKKKL